MQEFDKIIETIKSREHEEEIFVEPENRHVIFPLTHHNIWYNHYKKHMSTFWTVEEVNLTNDIVDWKKLDEEVREYILKILAFFAASDGIVCENLLEQFMIEVKIPEVKFYYTFQAAMENIHSEMYATLIDTFELDLDKKHKLFNAVQYSAPIGKKADWALRWIGGDQPFAMRLLAFIIVEGVFFSSSFAGIFWIRSRGLGLPGLVLSNDFISRDEGLHTDFGIEIYKMLKNRLPENIVHSIFKEAVECEINFTEYILPTRLKGMNATLMSQYVKYVADRLCNQLGYTKIYNVSNPFGWMENISVQGKSNFFERTVSEYKVGNNMSSEFGMLDNF